MKNMSGDLDRIGIMIANGQNLGACLNDLRSFERRIKELKSQIAVQAAATRTVNNAGKKRSIEWPVTACLPEEEALSEEQFSQISLLSYFGYRVGKSGLGSPERQRILKYAFLGELPRVWSEGHMKRWGEPGTPNRLKMLVGAIVDLMGYTKEKSGKNDLTAALRDWRSDLKWLKKAYYAQLPKGCFKWPVGY